MDICNYANAIFEEWWKGIKFYPYPSDRPSMHSCATNNS